MPKIIENPESRLVAEARKQALEGGYSAVTIRSVAAACGLGVGTVYNDFPSKDALPAAFLLEDWKECLRAVEAAKAARRASRPTAKNKSCNQKVTAFIW